MAKRRYHPAFPYDLRAAILHFDGISSDLGQRFRSDVREKLASISQNPEIYARLFGEIRASRLSHFPYVVLYTLDTDTVYFISLVLGSSDRTNWFHRIK